MAPGGSFPLARDANQPGANPSQQAILGRILTHPIEFVPEILDVLSARAEEVGVDLQSVLDAVDAYFHKSDGVISEDLENLYGLLNDAYVAICVVEFLCRSESRSHSNELSGVISMLRVA